MTASYRPRRGAPRDYSLFDRIASISYLKLGFERVYRNQGCAGGDGISCAVFSVGLEKRLSLLSERLISQRYRPGPVAIFEIPKKNSASKRVLRVPCVVDRVVQASALAVLQDVLEPEFEPFSYAYRPNRSVKMAVDAVVRLHKQGYHWVVDVDLKSFFDEVPHHGVLASLSDYVPEQKLIDLVGLWLDLAAHPEQGLPQGAPISPILANLYLDQLDEHLEKSGFRMVRYADDFVLLCKSEKDAERAMSCADEKLTSLGLRFHPDKTRVRHLDEGYVFLGKDLNSQSIFHQTLQLADLPGGAEPVMDVQGHMLEGGLNAHGSRRIMRMEVEASAHSINVNDPLALNRPWVAEHQSVPVETVSLDEENDGLASGRYAPFLRPLYLHEKGRRLEVQQQGFALMEGDLVVALISCHAVDKIEVFPGVDVSIGAIHLSAASGIPIFFLDGRGETRSVLAPEQWARHKLHLAQANHSLDEAKAAALARQFVLGRVYNARRLLQRLRGRLPAEKKDDYPLVEDAIRRMDYCWRRAERSQDLTSVASIMSIEAEAASFYWPALSSLVKRGFAEEDFVRSRTPALSPFNALLNFTAWLLRRDVETMLLRRGVHIGFGVLHSVSDQRSALVFDVMEEFRAPIAEAVAVVALSSGALGVKDFVTADVDGSRAVNILPSAQKTLIRLYERHVDNRVKDPIDHSFTTWRGMIDHQISRYIRHISAIEPYLPYRMDV